METATDISAKDGPQYRRLEHSILASIVGQMVDKLSVSRMLSYGEMSEEFWLGFAPQREVAIQSYRPQIEGPRSMASPSDLVVCVDHLEHTGQLGVADSLDDLKRVTLGCLFAHVKLMEFPGDLQDLRTVDRPATWWLTEFVRRFDLQTFQRLPGGLYVIAYPLPTREVIH